MKFLEWLKGKKTVTMGILILVYAGSGYATGYLDGASAWAAALAAMSLLGLRDAIANINKP